MHLLARSRRSPHKSTSGRRAFRQKTIGGSASAFAGEIEAIKERLRTFYLAFAHAIVGMRDASVSARAIVPEAPELSNLLIGFATEVAVAVDKLLGDLDRRIEPLGAGQAAPQLPQPFNGSPELLQNSYRVLRLPGWLPRSKPTEKESL